MQPVMQAALEAERERLLAFGRAARSPVGGFGHLDVKGRLATDAPIPTFETCRFTYCYVLSTLLGHSDDADLVRAGLRALLGELRDPVNDGWYATLAPDGSPTEPQKQAYVHAFVLLAAASATALDEPLARELFDAARAVIDEHFWDDTAGVMRESFAPDWSQPEAYRGANANMHSVEALLVASDALSSTELLDRANRIANCFINHFARDYGWRIPEHYTADLEVVPDYNRDDPMHHFRPYGITPGHLLEWSRLCVQLGASLTAAGYEAPWQLGAAQALYDRAVSDGWSPDGQSGFVYTVDWDGAPVARTRMFWVIAEAMGAAASLHNVTGEQHYLTDLERWWTEASTHFIDLTDGSWHHALDENNLPTPEVWGGKPDIYHAVQATILPSCPPAPSLPFFLARQ